MASNNGDKRLEDIIMDDVSAIVDGLLAIEALKSKVRTLCYKPYVSRADTNMLSRELQRVETGLHAGRGRRLDELKELEKR